MRQGTSGFERGDALVCADVLGGFGVSSDHVRERVADGDGVDDLETAIQRALADPEHPTAFVRRTVAAAPRGVDSPARFWTTAPETQLGDVFAAIDWTFDVKNANGRSLSVADAQPYRLRVEDADGRTRSCEFSFPDTPLGDDNYPALVHAINEHLLYGLDCRFVQLSDGTDRWRFALVATDEYDRLVDRFGERVTAFDRPLLAADQPAAYVPDGDAPAADDGVGTDSGTTDDAVGRTEGGVPVPGWARESRERSWRGRRLTADAFDADHVGGLDHLDDGDADAESRDGAADAAAAIEFVDDSASDSSDTVGSAAALDSAEDDEDASTSDAAGVDPDERTMVRDAEATVRDAEASVRDGEASVPDAGERSTGADASGTSDDDLDGWSIGGSVDATTRSPGSTEDATSSVDADASALESDASTSGPDASTSRTGGADDGVSASGFTWGDERSDATTDGVDATGNDDSGASDAASASDGDGEDGFFSADAAASFDAGAKTSRVEGDSFGVDAGEQTEDDRFAAVGAALAAPAGISCAGLLDDDEFLPHLPRAEPEETRLEFDDEFDPTADPADQRETDDGFVWVNESSTLDEDRTSASD